MGYHRGDVVELAIRGARHLRTVRPVHAPPRCRARGAAQCALPPLRQQADPARRRRRRDPRTRVGASPAVRVGRPRGSRVPGAARRDAGLPRRGRAGRHRARLRTGRRRAVRRAGHRPPRCRTPAPAGRTAARTLLHLVFGHTSDEQTHLQAGSVGAIDDDPREGSDLEVGLALLLDGIRSRVPARDSPPRLPSRPPAPTRPAE